MLLAQPDVASVAQIGNELRVLMTAGAEEAPEAVDGADAAARLRQALAAAGIEAEVAAIVPNLEDVFVAATRDGAQSQERAA